MARRLLSLKRRRAQNHSDPQKAEWQEWGHQITAQRKGGITIHPTFPGAIEALKGCSEIHLQTRIWAFIRQRFFWWSSEIFWWCIWLTNSVRKGSLTLVSLEFHFWAVGARRGHQSQFTNYSLGQVSPGTVRVWAHEKISHLYDALTSSGSLSAYDLPVLTTHLGAGRAPHPQCSNMRKLRHRKVKWLAQDCTEG